MIPAACQLECMLTGKTKSQIPCTVYVYTLGSKVDSKRTQRRFKFYIECGCF